MIATRAIAVLLSLLVHSSLVFALMPKQLRTEHNVAIQTGTGDDLLNVEEGIAIEGLAKLGDDLETIQTQEVAAVQPTPPKPIEEKQPDVDELSDTITSEASTVEDNIIKSEEPPPVEELKDKVPEVEEKQPEMVAEAVPEQVAIIKEQSSGRARDAGSATERNLYRGKIFSKVQRSLTHPGSNLAGIVEVRFTLSLDGTLLKMEVAKSSGSRVLDSAAITALERAAPFPPIPIEVSAEPMAFTQSFRFTIR